jgi:hypothetical protein
VVLLKFWFGLAVQYFLPGRQRMECSAFRVIGDLLLGGPLWLDHMVFAIRPFVFANMSGAGQFSGGPHAFEQHLVLGSFAFPMSRASIRFSANERRRSSSASFHGLVVKNSCPAISSPSPEFHKPGHTARFDGRAAGPIRGAGYCDFPIRPNRLRTIADTALVAAAW